MKTKTSTVAGIYGILTLTEKKNEYQLYTSLKLIQRL